MEEEYIEKNPLPGIHVHRLTLYAKMGPRNHGGRIHEEYTSMGSHSMQRWVHEMEEEYIEKNLRPYVHDIRGLTLNAKVGTRNGRRIHT
jgi:hypothetical protein